MITPRSDSTPGYTPIRDKLNINPDEMTPFNQKVSFCKSDFSNVMPIPDFDNEQPAVNLISHLPQVIHLYVYKALDG